MVQDFVFQMAKKHKSLTTKQILCPSLSHIYFSSFIPGHLTERMCAWNWRFVTQKIFVSKLKICNFFPEENVSRPKSMKTTHLHAWQSNCSKNSPAFNGIWNSSSTSMAIIGSATANLFWWFWLVRYIFSQCLITWRTSISIHSVLSRFVVKLWQTNFFSLLSATKCKITRWYDTQLIMLWKLILYRCGWCVWR